ncbi:fructosamine kinase family protein [Rhabdobacter roseus]|uniref:Fructosamine-3-kinase n=1 Tax=Rhabdobacter roseus TaxID=1655419 RepID=A0A840TQG5_9BACT|nr:fructosamine kinase family protein [Rhabdobacter roseus]MBB5282290.1 fructosamine-3-kinase [Rhabdobacter roseus]
MHTGQAEIQLVEGMLFQTFGQVPLALDVRLLPGGSINMAVRAGSSLGTFFIKWNDADRLDMFLTEAQGLEVLRQTGTFSIPEVLGQGTFSGKAYLVLEYIEPARHRPEYWPAFGEALAQLHQHTQASFGLSFDNYLGALPQRNALLNDGIEFFIENRLKPQAGLALYNNLISKVLYDRFEKLYQVLPDLLPPETPALLHGDLWSGNVIVDTAGRAALVDPAPYYGLREAEMAFTKLFGGFDGAFYQRYFEVLPVEPGFKERIPLYNLYPLLVHVNLFGKSYVSAVERVVNRF